jgi:hypothetical protein
MFERYTEKARRCIFWGRYEASQAGSPYIESTHLLLGVLREHPDILDDRVLTGKFAELVRSEMKHDGPPLQPTSTSVDLPLSHEAKRILAYGAEEAERMGHKHIGTEHLLLGFLREEGSLGARLLRQHGIELGSRRARIAALAHLAPAPEDVPVYRNALHALIDSLPEGALLPTRNVLMRMQTLSPEAPLEISELRPPRKTFLAGGGVAGAWVGGARGDGSRFSSRMEDGALIREKREVFHGHEITMWESFKMSDDGKQLKYSQHLRGPKRENQLDIDFEVG